MKRLLNIKMPIKPKPLPYYEINTHKWATKMEIRQRFAGKPELKLKAAT